MLNCLQGLVSCVCWRFSHSENSFQTPMNHSWLRTASLLTPLKGRVILNLRWGHVARVRTESTFFFFSTPSTLAFHLHCVCHTSFIPILLSGYTPLNYQLHCRLLLRPSNSCFLWCPDNHHPHRAAAWLSSAAAKHVSRLWSHRTPTWNEEFKDWGPWLINTFLFNRRLIFLIISLPWSVTK